MVKNVQQNMQAEARSLRGEARARLLQAAIDSFAERGFEGTGARQVAFAAGVNHSVIAYHFGSMEGLWREAMADLFAGYRARVERRVEGLAGLSPAARLEIAIEDLIRFSKETPALHRIMTMEGRARTPRLDWLINQQLKPMFEAALPVIVEGQREGSVRAYDPALLYYALISLCATPFSLRPEFEAVTGRDLGDEVLVRELGRMVRTLVFAEVRATPQEAADES